MTPASGHVGGSLESASCPLCGARELALVYRQCPDRRHWLPGLFDVGRCVDCGLVRTNPRPCRESIGLFYPESYVSFVPVGKSARPPLYRLARTLVHLPHRWRHGQSDIGPPPHSGARGIDVGCGGGYDLVRLRDLGWEPYGLEPDEATAEHARLALSATSDRVVCASVEDAEFESGSFELALLTHVLEHLHDPVVALQKIHGWLCAGATLRLRVPNFASVERRVFGRMWFGLDIPRHLFHFTPQTMSQVVEAAGFEVQSIRAEAGGTSLVGSLRHLMDGMTRRSRQYRTSRVAYLATLPAASLLSAVGCSPSIEMVARRR